MNNKHRSWLMAVLLVASGALWGCGEDQQEPSQVGEVNVALTATSSSGVQYALFSEMRVEGPEAFVVFPDPFDGNFLREVTAGSYTVELLDGYELFNLDTGNFEPGVLLVSDNPAAVEVPVAGRGALTFSFAIPGGEQVSFETGTLDVGFEVVERLPNGAACQADADCLSGACVGGICGGDADLVVIGELEPTFPDHGWGSHCEAHTFSVDADCARIQVAMDSSWDNMLFLAQAGQDIAFNDDAVGLSARIDHVTDEAGQYTVYACAYDAYSLGTYSLEVRVTEVEHDSVCPTTDGPGGFGGTPGFGGGGGSDGFLCPGGEVIPWDWQCDGIVDCADESDEEGCLGAGGTGGAGGGPVSTTECGGQEFEQVADYGVHCALDVAGIPLEVDLLASVHASGANLSAGEAAELSTCAAIELPEDLLDLFASFNVQVEDGATATLALSNASPAQIIHSVPGGPAFDSPFMSHVAISSVVPVEAGELMVTPQAASVSVSVELSPNVDPVQIDLQIPGAECGDFVLLDGSEPVSFLASGAAL